MEQQPVVRELARLVRLLEPLEHAGTLNVPGLATLNRARAALAGTAPVLKPLDAEAVRRVISNERITTYDVNVNMGPYYYRVADAIVAHFGVTDAAERLAEALKNLPTDEYHDALSDGDDPSGAWDCFTTALHRHVTDAIAAYEAAKNGGLQ